MFQFESMTDQPPESFVRGCNDPVTIGILSDWIEEQYGITLDLDKSGWSDYCNDYYGCLDGSGYGYINGNGYGSGFSNNRISGNGYGNGHGYNNGYGYGYGNGNGNGYGFNNGISYSVN